MLSVGLHKTLLIKFRSILISNFFVRAFPRNKAKNAAIMSFPPQQNIFV